MVCTGRSIRLWTLVSVVVGLVAISSGIARGAECPSADAPTFAVGDEWRNEGGAYPVVSRVVAVEADGTVVESNADPVCQGGCRYVRDGNLANIRATDKNGEPAYITGVKQLDFPLQIGKKWEQRIDFRLASGAMEPFQFRMKVEACEEVKVKAGAFRAFRISMSMERLGGRRGVGEFSYWWAPEARAFVKRRAHTSGWGDSWELVSYTVK